MKPTCCNYFLLSGQWQSGSNSLVLDLKTSNDFLLFIALQTRDHTLGAK